MTRIQPTSDIHKEFATNQKTGDIVDNMCILTLDRQISSLGEERVQGLANVVQGEIGGVESFRAISPYSFEVVVAKTFPPAEVIAEIEKEIKLHCSPLIVPNNNGGKIIQGDFDGC